MDCGGKPWGHVAPSTPSTPLRVCCLLGLLVALLHAPVTRAGNDGDDDSDSFDEVFCKDKKGIPCPPLGGGLVTSGDPKNPGPFHDVTKAEYKRLYAFLAQLPELNLARPEEAAVNASSVFMADLHLPAKQGVLAFLDQDEAQPTREARVMVFRGDKAPPVVEE